MEGGESRVAGEVRGDGDWVAGEEREGEWVEAAGGFMSLLCNSAIRLRSLCALVIVEERRGNKIKVRERDSCGLSSRNSPGNEGDKG